MSNNPSLINIPDLPESMDNAMKNITDKPTAAIGNTFSDLWFLVFGGISHLANMKRIQYNHDLEEYRKLLENSIDQIPEEKRIEPSIQTTAQALENSKYCVDQENLRDMFVALISNSMNADYQADVHPSFAEIIKQMSPMDAEVIKIFKKSSTNGFALARYDLVKDDGYDVLLENVFLKYVTPNLAACSLSISSLVRLGLLKTSYSIILVGKDAYKPFELHPWYKLFQERYPDNKIDIRRGTVALTPLGRSFVRVCISD